MSKLVKQLGQEDERDSKLVDAHKVSKQTKPATETYIGAAQRP